jgi:predicted dehydrogenase
MNVGIIGCGNISKTYLNCHKLFNNFKVIACADINHETALNSAKEFNVTAQSVDELLNNDSIELIINLTNPSAHKEIIKKTLEAGKHSFSEKPLATNFNDGLELKKFADEKNLKIGCAPDTFLGAAGQLARNFVDKGLFGKIALGTFNMMSHGMEYWHPSPDFFFKPGAGPIFDVGVYYITLLVNLFGSVEKISSVSTIVEKERIILSEPRKGDKISVETPTTLMSVLEFSNQTIIQLFASWDVWKHNHSEIELYGTQGSLILPDPNFFGGDLRTSEKESDWIVHSTDKMLLGIPNEVHGDKKFANYRGIGLSDMVKSIENYKKPRCSIDLALHVLEIMDGILNSGKNESTYKITTHCDRPEELNEEEIRSLKI